MPKINPQRLLDDLHTLRSFGRSDNGVVRLSLSSIDLESRRWLRERMLDAGLDARIDGVGNVFGRSNKPGPALLIGSHSDTQPRGGWLDGALGVIYGLEVARAIAESPETRDYAVDAVSWIDEEGTFLGCLGSRSFCGLLADDEIDAAAGAAGQSLREALTKAGLDGVATRPEQGRYLGYLEAHIEQGPYLEQEGKKIGVVSSIVGSRNFTVRFSGQQNHAGTTPMPLRRDAGMALVNFAHDLNQAFGEIAEPTTVWTFGRVQFDPGAASIIPGYAEMHVQFRDQKMAVLDRFEAKIHELIAITNHDRPVRVEIEAVGKPSTPTPMELRFQEQISLAAEQYVAGQWRIMPSAAIHDAMYLARIMPAGMLFVPSIAGISHDFAEDTAQEDIVIGCQVMATAVENIMRQLSEQ